MIQGPAADPCIGLLSCDTLLQFKHTLDVLSAENDARSLGMVVCNGQFNGIYICRIFNDKDPIFATFKENVVLFREPGVIIPSVINCLRRCKLFLTADSIPKLDKLIKTINNWTMLRIRKKIPIMVFCRETDPCIPEAINNILKIKDEIPILHIINSLEESIEEQFNKKYPQTNVDKK